MWRKRAMTLVEVLVVISIIALLIGILLPGLGAWRRSARGTLKSSQIRGIHQGYILFSQNNNGYYAGLTRDGKLADAVAPEADKTYGAAKKLGSLSMAILLNGNFFTPGYLVSPGETNHTIKVLTTPTMVTTLNYSYAISRAEDPTADAGRITEWHDNTNGLAVVITDRVLAGSAEAFGPVSLNLRRSIWTQDNGHEWRGTVVFGDNSTDFLTTSILTKTKYGKTTNKDDDLFQGAGPADAFQFRD